MINFRYVQPYPHVAIIYKEDATFEQLKMFITRIGWDSKAVINGDIDQTDLASKDQGGLEEFLERLEYVEGCGIAELT